MDSGPFEPEKPRFKRHAAAALAGAVCAAVLGAAWTGAWHWLSVRAAEEAQIRLEAHSADPGAKARFACPAITRTGFPLHIGIACEKPSVTFKNGARWRGPPVTLQARLWRPSRWRAAWGGRHRITGPGADGRETVFTARTLAGLFDASETAGRFEISIADAAGESGPLRGWALESARMGAARDGAENIGFELRVTGAVLPESLSAGAQMGRRIERFAAAGDITGLVLVPGRAPSRTRRLPPGAAQLAEWRDAGGVIEFTEISAVFGALTAEGGGTMALDALLQPQGAFSLRISGYEETLTALAARGVMKPGAAAMAGFILSAMAEKPGDGGAPYVEAPVSIQNSKVSVGPLKIADLPPVRWPE